MSLFENYDRRIEKINGVLAEYGIIRCFSSPGMASLSG